jgi:hypothetical protein
MLIQFCNIHYFHHPDIPGGNFSGVPANRETSLPSGQTRYNSLYSWVNVLWHIPPAWG